MWKNMWKNILAWTLLPFLVWLSAVHDGGIWISMSIVIFAYVLGFLHAAALSDDAYITERHRNLR